MDGSEIGKCRDRGGQQIAGSVIIESATPSVLDIRAPNLIAGRDVLALAYSGGVLWPCGSPYIPTGCPVVPASGVPTTTTHTYGPRSHSYGYAEPKDHGYGQAVAG